VTKQILTDQLFFANIHLTTMKDMLSLDFFLSLKFFLAFEEHYKCFGLDYSI